MSDQMWTAIITSGIAVTLLNFILNMIKDIIDRRRGLRAAMRILLDEKLCHLGDKYLEQGTITQEQLKVFVKMHQSYKALGGNGYHATLMKKIDNLPIKGEERD